MPKTKTPFPMIRKALEDAFKGENLHFRPASNAWVLDGRSLTTEALTVKCYVRTDVSSQERIRAVLNEWAADEMLEVEKNLDRWVQSLETRKIDDAALSKWLDLMQSDKTTTEASSANLHAMKQWIWQVKRNIAGKPVEWQVMPIFWSKAQGTGKSYNINALLSPLKHFMKNMSVSDVGEQFSGKQLSQSLVLFFDEFVGVSKKQTALLKTILTNRDFDRRAMHSEDAHFAKNRLSCIATTNEAPPHGYEDETGVRRIWSIEASSEPVHGGSMRSKMFNMLDVDEIWGCVSIHDPSPESTIDRKLATYMRTQREGHLRARSPLESFCKDCLIKNETTLGEKVRYRDVRLAMNTYCSEHGLKKITGDQKKMCDELNKLGFQTKNTGNIYMLLNCTLKDENAVDKDHLT